MHFIRAVSLAFAASCLPAQFLFVVDASGQHGTLRTIQSAVDRARSNDVVMVMPGNYPEAVRIRGKAVSILGVGTQPGEVVIGDPNTKALSIEDHPAGGRSRFRLLHIHSFSCRQGDGQVIFDSVHFDNVQGGVAADVEDHRGSVAFQACEFWSPAMHHTRGLLCLLDVTDAFLDACTLKVTSTSIGVDDRFGSSKATCRFRNARVYLQSCNIAGLDWAGTLLPSPQPAIWTQDSELRIAGTAQTVIRGGEGAIRGPTRATRGATAIDGLLTSILWSGTTIQGGAPVAPNNPARVPAIQGHRLTAVEAHPPIPLVSLDSQQTIQPGANCTVSVFAQAGEQSFTAMALGYRLEALPLGTLAIDTSRPFLHFIRQHDTHGEARIAVELGPLPASAIGTEYVIQSMVLGAQGRVSLSLPRIGVVGH